MEGCEQWVRHVGAPFLVFCLVSESASNAQSSQDLFGSKLQLLTENLGAQFSCSIDDKIINEVSAFEIKKTRDCAHITEHCFSMTAPTTNLRNPLVMIYCITTWNKI